MMTKSIGGIALVTIIYLFSPVAIAQESQSNTTDPKKATIVENVIPPKQPIQDVAGQKEKKLGYKKAKKIKK